MKSENGRSMVEMLGVLAIIGVLSVGAISGYSKAMFKYKLNKHTEQMTTVFNAIARNVHSFDNLKEDGTSLTSYFIKMGDIPTEMVKSNNNDYVYDIFGQQWQILINNSAITLYSIHLDGSSFLSSNSSDNLAICQNILSVAKENSDNISEMMTATGKTIYSLDDHTYYILGDKLGNYCDMGYICLKNLTLEDIHTICTEHIKGGAGIFGIGF